MRFLRQRRTAHRPIDLNVIPLIDVVFFLLIFYVISTSFLSEAALPIDRPASSQATTVSEAFVSVAVVSSGAIQVGTRILDLPDVSAAVHAALAAGSTRKVVVIADRAVPTGLLLQVMDACTAGGASSVDVAAIRDGS